MAMLGPALSKLLSRYGLSSLTSWATAMVITGATEAEIEISLYERPEFRTRFPGIFAREQAGKPPMSVDEYLNYENTAYALSTMWDIPLDKSEIDGLISNDVSPVELENRFNIAAQAVYQTPREDQLEFMRLYNVTDGRLAKYWMDPKKEMGKLQQEFTAARIAGSAIRSGYGSITALQAERLGSLGMTPEAASEGFGTLYNMRELFEPIDVTETAFDQDAQIGILAGEADILEAVEDRSEKRKAEFGGGGEFAAGGEGFKGTGVATS